MGRMTLPFSSNEIRIPVLVSWHTVRVEEGIVSRHTVPVAWRNAVLDTGSNITIISNQLVKELDLERTDNRESQTAGGVQTVALYRVSLGLQPIFGLTETVILSDNIFVAVFPEDIPDVDVLLGLDVVSRVRITIDGPASVVTIEVPSPAA
jgi:hypothetical protein